MEIERASAVASEKGAAAAVSLTVAGQHHGRKPFRRKRRASGDSKRHRPPHKKAKLNVSSTHAANNVMRFRLGGSVSDPLNLEGTVSLSDECSTCAPSPAPVSNEEVIPPPLMTPHLNKDPLNLEGKVKNFPLLSDPSVASKGASGKGPSGKGPSGKGASGKAVTAAGQRRKPRRRTTSGSKPEEPTSKASSGDRCPKPLPKERKFRYGNYNRYYGYRNHSMSEADPRLALLCREWLQDKDCLDIGCNTGQVTIQLAKEKHPRRVLGIDIDNKLIETAWKNLHRSYIPSLTPDGRPFPASLTLSRGPVDFPPTPAISTESPDQHRQFPHNVQFVQGNYVPSDDVTIAALEPEFDVILALSLSKWVHLNWGDVGIKRLFRKVYQHLRPGGKFIFEPQPFSSYSKRKKLTEQIFENYKNIHFRPHEFHSYLLSPEVGFSAHQFLGVPDNKSKGFQRPIHMYTKGVEKATHPGAPHPPPVTSNASPVSEDMGRLKSVVVTCPGTQAN